MIPPVVALLVTTRARGRLALGWGMGILGAIIGIIASVGLDLPAGPSVMTALVAAPRPHERGVGDQWAPLKVLPHGRFRCTLPFLTDPNYTWISRSEVKHDI